MYKLISIALESFFIKLYMAKGKGAKKSCLVIVIQYYV